MSEKSVHLENVVEVSTLYNQMIVRWENIMIKKGDRIVFDVLESVTKMSWVRLIVSYAPRILILH